MKIKQTERGFDIAEFEDEHGDACSLQKSSMATDDCVWLGINAVKHQTFVPGKGWKEFALPDQTHCFARMHLTRGMVEKLLPYLTRFVETGELTE